MGSPTPKIPAWQLYGEESPFPDILHVERIVDRAAGLHWHIAPHRHLHLHQVFLILSGGARLTVDGRTSRPGTPAVVNVPRGTVHGFDFAPGTDGFVMTLAAADFPELFAPQSEAVAVLGGSFTAPLPPGMAAELAALAEVHARSGPLRRLRLRAGAVALCCRVAECAPAGNPARAAAGDPRIAAFEAQVRGSLDRHMSLADQARALGLSERHLRRLCLQATGLSAHALVDAIRLREACRLLAYTRMQVQEVGFALGYDDPAYFARAFRRSIGLSPGAYRARLDGQDVQHPPGPAIAALPAA